MSERTVSRPRKPIPPSSISPKSQTLTLILKMRKLLLPLLLSLSFLFLYFFLSPSSSPSNPNSSPSPSSRPRVPKIYLYDLPNKFTGGVVEKYAAVRSAAAKYPGHQHSAEWALLEDLRRPDRSGSPVERTADPEVADLFYVPFFSSLSLIVNPIRPAEGDEGKSAAAYSDEEVQEELMEWWKEASTGRGIMGGTMSL
ncbi:putative arabinosyltransferase ARAD1 [Iris pallida]|uniref:Arabinosyltransferase ARAD1 n=1 Tax=Iris pallida TaxID=29817 RepID=A0AAX6EXH4_IRIPA|nr:putative arabinosyltransferase ARAD1 [Iris pallida]